MVKHFSTILQMLKTALMTYPYIREKFVQSVPVSAEKISHSTAAHKKSEWYALLY